MSAPIIGLGEILWDLLPNGPSPGGAPFNFAFHCHQLGHPAYIVSRVGDDPLGHSLRTEVRRLGLSDAFIQIDPQHPTGTVKVQVDPGGQPSYTITENVAWDFLEWREELNPLIRSASAVCFGTLAQRHEVSRATIQRFVASFGENKLRICDLNLRPPFVDIEIIQKSIRLADWLKLNEGEFRETVPMIEGLQRFEERWRDVGWTDIPLGLPPQLLQKFLEIDWGPALVCMTRGERGCLAWTGFDAVDVPGIPIQIADTVGAGDAFTAGLLTQMLEGQSLADSARFANALAALVASQRGGIPVIERAQVQALL